MKILSNGYTEGEVKLISAFGYGYLVKDIRNPMTIYRMCVDKVFVLIQKDRM